MSAVKVKDINTLLSRYYKDEVEVIEQISKLLTAPGENYGGVMLALDIKIKFLLSKKTENKQIVAKLCPANQMLCDIFNIQETFKKELGMYLHAIPALAELEKEFGIKEHKIEDMFAKCFGGRFNLNPDSSLVDQDAVLLLENLKIIGYDMGDRLRGFDLKHSEMIIKNLAIFHAGPIALQTLNPSKFEEKIRPFIKGIQLGDGFDEKGVEFMISEVIDALKNNVKCIPYLPRLIEAMRYNLVGPYRTNYRATIFNTIVHSDYWVNNTMVLLDGHKNPVHNMIVDLQLTMYNSCIYDLLFFLFSSVEPSILYANLDSLLKMYYDTLTNRLKIFLNSDVLEKISWEAFTKEIIEVAPLEIGHILIMHKPILTKRGAIDDMSTFDENTMYKKDIVTDDFEKRILEVMLCFIDRKWF